MDSVVVRGEKLSSEVEYALNGRVHNSVSYLKVGWVSERKI